MEDPAGFNEVIMGATEIDFFSGVLPFLISYIIFFLAFNRMPLLNDMDDDKSRKISALMSVILSLYVSYFLVTNPVYQTFFSQFFGRIVIGIIGLIGLMVLLATIGINLQKIRVPYLIGILIIMAVSAFSLSGGARAFLPEAVDMDVTGFMTVFEYLIETGLIWVIVVAAALVWVSTESDTDWGAKARWGFRPVDRAGGNR